MISHGLVQATPRPLIRKHRVNDIMIHTLATRLGGLTISQVTEYHNYSHERSRRNNSLCCNRSVKKFIVIGDGAEAFGLSTIFRGRYSGE